MKSIILNGSKIKNMETFHEQIAVALDFPDYYGKNMDALWDCLTGHIDTEIELIWENHINFKNHALNDFNKIIDIFKELREESPEFILTLK